jgi:ferredoxin-NADP reductase
VNWRVASVIAFRDESPSARSLTLQVPEWPGHDAGQHVDVRLTAPDGYTAVRSYSIATAPNGDHIELTVEQIVEGEVSPYLTGVVAIGDRVEVRGPIGGWFVWRPSQQEAVQLIAGGSGLVPLIAMMRTRSQVRSKAPFRLLYSVRQPEAVLYKDDLRTCAPPNGDVVTTYAYTRIAPAGEARAAGRVDAALIGEATWPPSSTPTCYVCGPTPFVETVAGLLGAAGHDPSRIRTERFGPTGGTQ